MSRPRGYSLIELLVIVAIVAVALAAGIAALRSSTSNVNQYAGAQDEAREFAQLGAALTAWSNQQKKTLPKDTAVHVEVDALVAGGYLPATFANHANGVGHTPLGQEYRASVIRSGSDDKVRGVVWAEGDLMVSQLQAMNASTSAESLTALSRQISATVFQTHGVPCGILSPGSGTVQGADNTFSRDISNWLDANALEHPTPVALVGFPELSGMGGDETTPPVPPVKMENCEVRQSSVGPGNVLVQAACPAGTHEESRWPVCQPYNPFAPQEIAWAFSGGIIIAGKEWHNTNEVIEAPCWVGQAHNYPCPHVDRQDYAVYALGTPFFREMCHWSTWRDCPGHIGDLSYRCEVEFQDPVLEKFPTQGTDVLCCR